MPKVIRIRVNVFPSVEKKAFVWIIKSVTENKVGFYEYKRTRL